jgi:dihydroorotate dehydrogenase (NAD+) catalytic subunit
VVEFSGDPVFSTIGKILPFIQKSSINYAGMNFTAPWGFASGWADSFRKMKVVSSLGAGAVVSKTITYKPKKGNPYPRFFRSNEFIINSMGLPNHGLYWWIRELQKQKDIPENFIFSIKGDNLHEWKNLIKGIGSFSSIIELNFSCPNVANGIIDLTKSTDLLKDIRKYAKEKTIFLKISPEYTTSNIIDLIKEIKDKNLVDGVTCFNTFPVRYEYLGNSLKIGGISGIPLKRKLFYTIKEIRKSYSSAKELPIFGLGGIWNVAEALKLFKGYDVFPFVLSSFLINGPFLFRNWYKELLNLNKL